MNKPRFCTACAAPLIERHIDHYLRSLCTGCGKILYRNPVPATGCIVENDGAVLLARRKFEPWKGRWYVPSGFVEYGDEVEETARREVKEETGLVVELGPLFGVYSYFDDPRQDGIIILYRAMVVGGALEAGDDASEVAFFSARELPAPDQIGFASHRQALSEWRDEVLLGRVPPRAERART
jgi:ADP-ribose pyrophosphatase YjhB (NUDIX family)